MSLAIARVSKVKHLSRHVILGEDMLTVVGLKTCDSCRKAMRALKANGVSAHFRDLRDDPPGRDEVAAWHQSLGETLLNMRSKTWRALPEDARTSDPVALILAHPAVMKRPLILRDGAPELLGWTALTQGQLGLTPPK